MNQQILVLERTYQAPLQKVWEAITNKDQMRQQTIPISHGKISPPDGTACWGSRFAIL